MENFKIIKTNDNDFVKLYNQAYSWDKEHFCFQSKDIDLFALFSSCYGLYENENFIGYGMIEYEISINTNFRIKINSNNNQKQEEIDRNIKPSKPNKITLSYIINPDYRKRGYGTKLVQYLIKEAEQKKNYDLIEVIILKKNLASISLIEKCDFDFKSFDDKKIIFQKSIKNKV